MYQGFFPIRKEKAREKWGKVVHAYYPRTSVVCRLRWEDFCEIQGYPKLLHKEFTASLNYTSRPCFSSQKEKKKKKKTKRMKQSKKGDIGLMII